MSVSPPVSTRFRYYTYCIRLFYPRFWTKYKCRQSCAFSKVVKFDHFKIWIINRLPSP